ncbi:gamma-glutamyl peptidase 5-like isoform X2 [Cannabis sativa]|uniref:gamma-glutamyl peptidase 5-like isoform X2 n=1 Tax=Cannabis sativa TaxID=3483 RepID=UPI0029CA303F|nr:gamma-glutamyl peptidase 5-like isoform X2 [Cannabis sativa]
MEMMMRMVMNEGGDDDHGEKRFGLLLAARDSEYVKKMYGGYLNVFVEAFGEEGERWDLFRVVEGEFPELEDLSKYDGFVILDSMAKKVLGICFGHQVISRALGGKVGKSHSGWDLGIRKVNIVKDLPPLMTKLLLDEDEDGNNNQMIMPIISSFSIIECHQDEVLEVPIGANVIGYSEKTGVEMFMLESHILGIQGHPEYTIDILNNLIDRLLIDQFIQEDLAENAKNMLERTEPDRKCLVKICRKFLKGR